MGGLLVKADVTIRGLLRSGEGATVGRDPLF
jgi:hypothetical protein